MTPTADPQNAGFEQEDQLTVTQTQQERTMTCDPRLLHKLEKAQSLNAAHGIFVENSRWRLWISSDVSELLATQWFHSTL